MKPTTKKILIGSAIVLGAAALTTYRKATKIADIFEVMDIEPYYITKPQLDISKGSISFYLDVILRNNSGNDLFLTGLGVAQLSKVHLYYKGQHIATANVNITEISVPAKDTLIIKKIPVTVLGATILQNAQAFTNLDTIIDELDTVGVIEAMGNEYIIG